MLKKKQEKSKYEGLHGKELVEAIMRGETLGRPATEEGGRAYEKRAAELSRKYEREKEVKTKIGFFLKPIFYTPLAIMFHIITFVSRIIGGIASVAMIYGIYCAYKAFSAWKAGTVYTGDIKTIVMLLVFPFIAFAIATVSERLWCYFDDNRY